MPIRKPTLKPKKARGGRPVKIKDDITKAVEKYDGRRKHDWDAIRQTYVESKENLTWVEVGRMYGISNTTITTKANSESWKVQRAMYQAELMRKRVDAQQAWAVDESIKFDKQGHAAGQLGLALVMNRLIELQQIMQASKESWARTVQNVQNGLPFAKGEKWGAVDYRELEGLARAALTFQEVGRKALGTDAQNVNLNVEGSVDVEQIVNFSDEMLRDNPERLTDLIDAFARAGLVSLDNGGIEPGGKMEALALGGGDIVDAHIVSEETVAD